MPSDLSENEIRQIAEELVFVHPSAFHPKLRLTLEDACITPQTKQALDKLLIDFDDIMSHSSTDIGLVTLEEVLIETPPDALPIASKPYPLVLKHHQFVKEELPKLLQADLIEWSMSPYASQVLVVNKKSQHPLAELSDMQRLVIDYHGLNRLAPTVLHRQNRKVLWHWCTHLILTKFGLNSRMLNTSLSLILDQISIICPSNSICCRFLQKTPMVKNIFWSGTRSC